MSPAAVYAPTSARRGRQARQAARRAPPPPAPAYLTRRLPLYQMHGDEALALLETNADRILAEIGIDFIDDEALALWRAAGATIEGRRVRMPPGLCRELIASAPRQFIQHARNPARSVQVGGDATVFVPAYGAPFVSGNGGDRRYATLADFENFVKLAYLWLVIGWGLTAAAILWVPSVTHGMAQHAFTAGAIGHMTLVVMSRAALGHNGLPLKADALLSAAIACVFVGAVLRVTANFTGAAAGPVLMIAASLWSLAFLLFFSRILPLCWRRMPAYLAGDG